MNEIDLSGQTAVVTGGARGIGYAICERLRDSGAEVCIWDIDGTEGALAASKLKADIVEVDLTSSCSVAEATEVTLSRLGRIDCLINNAGIAGLTAPTWQIPPEEWRRVVEVDLVGPYLTCHNVIPHMLEQGSGRIINIASIAGKEGNPNASHYSAAKAGVIALTKSLGKELATSGLLVNCITPAVIETDILKQVGEEHVAYMLSKIPMGRFGRVDEVAAMVAWLCSADCSFTTGAVFDLSGGRATY